MELKAKTRNVFGKHTKRLRNEGMVPGEVYGHGFPNVHVSVAANDLRKLYRIVGEHGVFELVNEDTKEKIPALITDLCVDPITHEYLSVDFRHIRMDEKIEAKVPVTLVGEAPAVKNGYLVVTVVNEIHVKALPNAIPHAIEIDISTLSEPKQSIHMSDVTVPKNVEVLLPKDTVLVTVTEKAKEEVVTPPPAPEGTATPEANAASPTDEKPSAESAPAKK